MAGLNAIISARAALLAACIAAISGASAADEPPAPCPFTIEEVAPLVDIQLEEMEQSRVFMGISGIGIEPSALTDRLNEFVGNPQRRNGYPHAVVAYIVRDEAVCAIYSRHEDGATRTDMIALPHSASQLAAIVDAAMESFLRPAQAAPRAPRRKIVEEPSRGARPVQTLPAADVPDDAALLRTLAETLFPHGFFATLETQAGSLSIVPALNIGRVPFAALDLDGDGRPLADSLAINVEPSLKSVIDLDVYGWEWAAEKSVVFGDPDALDDPEWLLPRLPGAEREARLVAAMLGTQPVTGADATPSRFVRDALDASYIHVAAHGIASHDDPIDASFLALTGGRLTAREVQHLELSGSPVVVLSACQTALGGPIQAGIIGIARAFLLAGGVNVVSSLWNVDDEATAEIMRSFVSLLPQAPPVEALRHAQLQARERWPDPRIWAAFVVFGPRILGQ